jgi:two-component system, NtrC family, nitrogen regulation response regulator NtrX
MPAARILVVDDEPDIRDLVRDILEDEGYRVATAEHAAAAREALRRETPELILLDIWMPGTDGIGLLREWAEGPGLPCPVVMMSGHGTVETAVEATRLGAYDFIEKPIALAKLLITLERALEAQQLRAANAALRRQAQPWLEPVGDSAAAQALREQLRRLAAHTTPVLLRGETGTGKESLARWLHALGPRAEAPFVTVAAGAIAEGQSAATLFGAEGPDGIRAGLLEQAEGGTLFIDELAELGAELQLRLSSVIERRQLLRVGGSRPVPLDVRLVAASALDLDAERAAGRLRDELYFQLAVVPVAVPALRERGEDLPVLVAALVELFAARDGLPQRPFDDGAMRQLLAHPWPGNLRELRNLVQRLLLLGSRGAVDAAEVQAALGQAPAALRGGVAEPAGSALSGIDLDLPLREARDAFERAYLLRQLQQVGGSVGRLAKACGMERTHLYRKLKDLGVDIREAGTRDSGLGTR